MDPWMPVLTGFMLTLDDSSRIWVQCRYERVHKLCTRCGLIGQVEVNARRIWMQLRDGCIDRGVEFNVYIRYSLVLML